VRQADLTALQPFLQRLHGIGLRELRLRARRRSKASDHGGEADGDCGSGTQKIMPC
jgi:hypothetical protein